MLGRPAVQLLKWSRAAAVGSCRQFSSTPQITKVDYYYSQAATQITYWKTIQPHLINQEAGPELLSQASEQLLIASAAVSDPMHCDSMLRGLEQQSYPSDDFFPPVVCFVPADEGSGVQLG